MDIEVHIKDEAKFPGQWAFFGFDHGKVGNLFPAGAAWAIRPTQRSTQLLCSSIRRCFHWLRQRGTLSAAYLKESAAEKN